MATGVKLQLKQSQSLTMTPQLAQSIKLLQMGHAELTEFVNEEVERNPLLEIKTDTQTLASTPEKPDDNQSDTHTKLADASAEQVADLDSSTENLFSSEPAISQSRSSSALTNSTSVQNSNEDFDLVANLGETASLAQTLEFQIAMNVDDEDMRQIATYIVHALDDDGYFREDITATASHLKVSEKDIIKALAHVQSLEPTGVGARNLSECLRLQLLDSGKPNPKMLVLVEHLGLLAKHEFTKLKKICDMSADELDQAIRLIKTLDPRPAAKFKPILADSVVPDVLVSMKNDGSWNIDLNPETLPNVLVNRSYHAELSSVVGNGEAKPFVDDCLNNAKWLERSLDQRAQTILKVATEIIRQQDMFFAEGIEHLKPMNLATIASAIKMHESTVSRVTANKFLLCDQGIFELKYFFSSAIGTTNNEGDQLSSQSVKHQIKKLVDTEDPKKILSDDKLVELLQETGIDIARRTVAKYREALKIPSSVQRRREKRVSM